MLLYSCDGIKMDGVTEEMLVGGPCFRSASLPWDSCMKGSLLATLSVGYDAYSFPKDVSFSFGGPQGTEYMMLQIHYNNPQMLKGVKDFSGINIVYLDHPRKYDAGIMAIGHRITPFQLIPPGQDNFSVYGICDPSCTSKHIPRDGINVFSNLLHTHLAGRGLVLRQYRNGAEVTTPIDQDLNYDFNFQQIRTFPSRKIYPGDKIELQCKYSTSDRMKAVFGGLGTSQEMCLAFLYYYPRSPLLSCQSSLKTEALFQVLRLQKIARVSTSRLSLKQLQRTVSDPRFAWNQFSRATNLQALYKTTRTNISYLDLFCEVDDSMIHHQ
jgi:dopamine beta-monooxygenase